MFSIIHYSMFLEQEIPEIEIVWISVTNFGRGDLLVYPPALVGKTRLFITKCESNMVENGFLF